MRNMDWKQKRETVSYVDSVCGMKWCLMKETEVDFTMVNGVADVADERLSHQGQMKEILIAPFQVLLEPSSTSPHTTWKKQVRRETLRKLSTCPIGMQ